MVIHNGRGQFEAPAAGVLVGRHAQEETGSLPRDQHQQRGANEVVDVLAIVAGRSADNDLSQLLDHHRLHPGHHGAALAYWPGVDHAPVDLQHLGEVGLVQRAAVAALGNLAQLAVIRTIRADHGDVGLHLLVDPCPELLGSQVLALFTRKEQVCIGAGDHGIGVAQRAYAKDRAVAVIALEEEL